MLRFGSVSKIEIKNKKDIDGNISQTFAFIDIGVSDSGLSQCISTLANKKLVLSSSISIIVYRNTF